MRLRIRPAVILLAMFASPAVNVLAAPAAPYAWRNVTVGGGGFAPGIVFSRAERGLAYLRTDMGGAEADIDVATSVTGLTDVITARLGRPGAHYLDYRGETLPW